MTIRFTRRLVTNAAISLQSTTTGTLVKNNIVYAGGVRAVDAASETGTAFDYNDYFSASGMPFNWGGTAYSLSGWQTASSQDAHSLSADPGLVNASPLSSTGNYSLLAVSPAIDAGVNLGAAYQNGLAAASSWPGGVSLLNQNSAGGGWEIGGYVYLPQCECAGRGRCWGAAGEVCRTGFSLRGFGG